jgi:hypothetical protein
LIPPTLVSGCSVKIIWWGSQCACLFSKRLERGWFVWSTAKEGKNSLAPAQLAMLLGGDDWCALGIDISLDATIRSVSRWNPTVYLIPIPALY